ALLLLAAVGHDRRSGHAKPDHADVRRRLGARELLERDRLVRVRRALAAVLHGPGQAGVARVVLLAAPRAPVLVRRVRLDPLPHLGAEGSLFRAVAEFHVTTLTRTVAPWTR